MLVYISDCNARCLVNSEVSEYSPLMCLCWYIRFR